MSDPDLQGRAVFVFMQKWVKIVDFPFANDKSLNRNMIFI